MSEIVPGICVEAPDSCLRNFPTKDQVLEAEEGISFNSAETPPNSLDQAVEHWNAKKTLKSSVFPDFEYDVLDDHFDYGPKKPTNRSISLLLRANTSRTLRG